MNDAWPEPAVSHGKKSPSLKPVRRTTIAWEDKGNLALKSIWSELWLYLSMERHKRSLKELRSKALVMRAVNRRPAAFRPHYLHLSVVDRPLDIDPG